MVSKQVLIFLVCLVAAGLLVVAYLGSRRSRVTEPVGGTAPTVQSPDLSEASPGASSPISEQNGLSGEERPELTFSGPDEEIQRLAEFLDDNDVPAALEQAKFLAESEDVRRRDEAVDAMLWVGSPAAGQVILPLLNDAEPEVAERAQHALSHILATLATQIYEHPESGDLMMDADSEEGGASGDDTLQATFDLWVATCKATTDESALEELLIQLTSMDSKFAVPVLVDVIESADGAKRKMVLEYLDMATHGDGVTNREEAAVWLLKQYQD